MRHEWWLAGLVAAATLAAPASAEDERISKVRIEAVTQALHQPVRARLLIRAPVNHQIYFTFKVFRARGSLVYDAKKYGEDGTYEQERYSTAISIWWDKGTPADDGSRVRRGQRFLFRGYARDVTSGGGLIASSMFPFTLTAYPAPVIR